MGSMADQRITRWKIQPGDPPLTGFRAHWEVDCWCGQLHDPSTDEVAPGAERVPRGQCYDDHTYLMLNGLHAADRCDCV